MVPRGKIAEYEDYLAQVWWARAILHQGMPILGPLFRRLAHRYPKPENWDVSLYTSLMGEKMGRETRTDIYVKHVADEARVTCERIWGISVETQHLYENLWVPRIPHNIEVHSLVQTDVGTMEKCIGHTTICELAPSRVGVCRCLAASTIPVAHESCRGPGN